MVELGKKLVTFCVSEYKPKYSVFKKIVVNAKRLAYKWKQEGELEDIDRISELMIRDWLTVGK